MCMFFPIPWLMNPKFEHLQTLGRRYLRNVNILNFLTIKKEYDDGDGLVPSGDDGRKILKCSVQ